MHNAALFALQVLSCRRALAGNPREHLQKFLQGLQQYGQGGGAEEEQENFGQLADELCCGTDGLPDSLSRARLQPVLAAYARSITIEHEERPGPSAATPGSSGGGTAGFDLILNALKAAQKQPDSVR